MLPLGRLDAFETLPTLLSLLAAAPDDLVKNMFFHGPGGSGKTYFVTEVVLLTFNRFCPGCARGSAAQNSVASSLAGQRLISWQA